MNNFEDEMSDIVAKSVNDVIKIADKYKQNRNIVLEYYSHLINKIHEECKLDYLKMGD